MIRPILKSLSRAHMDVTLRSGPDYVVRIMERPALWMSDGQLASLRQDLRDIATKTLTGGALTYGVFSDRPTALRDSIVTLVTTKQGDPVAFKALAIMTLDTPPAPTPVLHLGLVMVDPGHRSAGLSWVLYGLTCFLLILRNQLRPLWVSNVTQVPAVVGMVSQTFSDVWPQPGDGRRTLTHVLLARRIMDTHRAVFGVGPDAGFDETRFVITDAYTGGSDALKKTLTEAPQHRDDAVNAFCAAELNYTRGDDLLQLGRMDIAAIRRYLMRDVPKTARLAVLVTGASVALQRLILPVIYWFDTTRKFSILRPSRDRALHPAQDRAP